MALQTAFIRPMSSLSYYISLIVIFLYRLGEHPMALSVFYSFLADRFQAADFEGSLTMNMLKVCITLSSGLYLLTNDFSFWLALSL